MPRVLLVPSLLIVFAVDSHATDPLPVNSRKRTNVRGLVGIEPHCSYLAPTSYPLVYLTEHFLQQSGALRQTAYFEILFWAVQIVSPGTEIIYVWNSQRRQSVAVT
jgi:hypothetical protein